MKIEDLQFLLIKAGKYTGPVDGIAGKNTWAAIRDTETVARAKWPEQRRMIAAMQVLLTRLKYDPGTVDGLWGQNTSEALIAFKSELVGGDASVNKKVIKRIKNDSKWPHQRDVESFFGKAGNSDCTAGKVILPIPFVIAWDKSKKVVRFSCHAKVADAMNGIFRDAVKHYGAKEYSRLELDIFGGCFNNRNMRGGSKKSMHAYGIAVDLNPEKNQLRWRKDRAQFAKAEYDAFWNIVEGYGGVSGGRAWGYDWMHFQFSKV